MFPKQLISHFSTVQNSFLLSLQYSITLLDLHWFTLPSFFMGGEKKKKSLTTSLSLKKLSCKFPKKLCLHLIQTKPVVLQVTPEPTTNLTGAVCNMDSASSNIPLGKSGASRSSQKYSKLYVEKHKKGKKKANTDCVKVHSQCCNQVPVCSSKMSSTATAPGKALVISSHQDTQQFYPSWALSITK